MARSVVIVEEGPREGFQSAPVGISTAAKLELIHALAEAGVPEMNCASFVSPKVLPQMADAEAVAAGIQRRPGVSYTCMWLNDQGFLRAQNSGLTLPAMTGASASDTFLRRNNNRTPQEHRAGQEKLRDLYVAAGLPPGPAYLFTTFGCNFEGPIPPEKAMRRAAELISLWTDIGLQPSCLYLCDTVGMADPAGVRQLTAAAQEKWPDIPVALHLHDTRGLGIANVMAGLEMGVTRFDASVGGLGGCPFAGNSAAAGNVATEEVVLLCERLGLDTGIDLPALLRAARLAQEIMGQPLPGKLFKAGLPRAAQ